MENEPLFRPCHYAIYPVQPIEITRYLGFCLGNAVKGFYAGMSGLPQPEAEDGKTL